MSFDHPVCFGFERDGSRWANLIKAPQPARQDWFWTVGPRLHTKMPGQDTQNFFDHETPNITRTDNSMNPSSLGEMEGKGHFPISEALSKSLQVTVQN